MTKLIVLGLVLLYIGYKGIPISMEGPVISFSALALAIQTAEGWYPGSRSYRNNNPGNLRYAGQSGAIGVDPQGFAIFPDYNTGFNALIAQLQLDAQRHPNWTLSDFVNSYAPPSENDTQAYLNNIVSIMQQNGVAVDPSVTLGEFS